MARDKLSIFNEAIGGVPADPIDDVDDTRKSGKECRRYYDGVVSDLVGIHDWSWANKRAALAQITNDRSGEWGYAYAVPSDMSSPITLVPNYGSSSSGVEGYVTTPLAYDYTQYHGNFDQAHRAIPYKLAGQVIYTDLKEAILEYSIDTVDTANWPSLFSWAVVKALESRIYRPILGSEADATMHRLKLGEAEAALMEAKADDLNRQPRRYPAFQSEADMARSGSWRFGPWRR